MLYLSSALFDLTPQVLQMALNTYDLYGELTVEIRGEGTSADKLRGSFNHFASNDISGSSDLVCEITRTEPDPERVLGAPDQYYGREGDRFIIKKPGNYGFMSIDSQWEHIQMSPNIDHYLVAYIVEFELRKRLASDGYTLIHASGVEMDGKALLFPSWRYTGKTNTMITFLQAGADYLSDDRLWVGADGTVQGYPVPVNMMPSNIESYPGLSSMTRSEKLRLQACEELYDRLDAKRSPLDKAAYFATKFYLDPDLGRELVPINKLMPGSEFVEQAKIGSVISLRTTLESPQNRVGVEEISGQDAVADIMAISHYEWDGRLKEYFRAYDALFSEHQNRKSDEIDALIAKEERNLSELLDTVPMYRGLIPRNKDWENTGIADDIVRKFSGLGSPMEVQQ